MAIDQMLAARSRSTPNAQGQVVSFAGNADFDYGLVIEAFAFHYLTDLFSSGHLRTPRGYLREHCQDETVLGQLGPDALGGALSSCMHDEDNILGLLVHARGAADTEANWWIAYGDNMSEALFLY